MPNRNTQKQTHKFTRTVGAKFVYRYTQEGKSIYVPAEVVRVTHAPYEAKLPQSHSRNTVLHLRLLDPKSFRHVTTRREESLLYISHELDNEQMRQFVKLEPAERAEIFAGLHSGRKLEPNTLKWAQSKTARKQTLTVAPAPADDTSLESTTTGAPDATEATLLPPIDATATDRKTIESNALTADILEVASRAIEDASTAPPGRTGTEKASSAKAGPSLFDERFAALSKVVALTAERLTQVQKDFIEARQELVTAHLTIAQIRADLAQVTVQVTSMMDALSDFLEMNPDERRSRQMSQRIRSISKETRDENTSGSSGNGNGDGDPAMQFNSPNFGAHDGDPNKGSSSQHGAH